MGVAALVVGAGRGERLRRGGEALAGERPKGLLPLAGRPMIVWSVLALAAAREIDWILPVVPADWCAGLSELDPALAVDPGRGVLGAVAGGAERQDSVRAGLRALPPEADLVAVHDAARPLVTASAIDRVVGAAREHAAALLAVPVADTVKRVRDGRVVETPPREECWAAQTPQVFRREILEEALAKASREGILGTDDAGLVERLGVPVHVVEGEPENRKITLAHDLAFAERQLLERGA